MHVFMYFLHLVPPITLHYIIMVKGLLQIPSSNKDAVWCLDNTHTHLGRHIIKRSSIHDLCTLDHRLTLGRASLEACHTGMQAGGEGILYER